MTREIAYLDVINRIKKYLTNIATVEYGESLSMDELLKFKSMDEIPSLTLRKKQHYFDKCQYILKNFEKKDTVDYILTLSKLYTDENFKDRFFDDTEILILLEIFNRISVNEYKMYLDLLNDFIYMRRLTEKINNIAREQNQDRRLAIIRDICSQFVTYLQKYKEENKDFANVSRAKLEEVITSFIPHGVSVAVQESISDNPIKR